MTSDDIQGFHLTMAHPSSCRVWGSGRVEELAPVQGALAEARLRSARQSLQKAKADKAGRG